MRSMAITDEWLYQHMPVVDNAMITALENQVDREYVFSKRFEQKMQKVIRREAHPVLTGAQQLLKRMAIFFTGIVCGGLVLTLSVDAYRDKFFMTLKTLREDATQYNYSSEEKDAVLGRITLSVDVNDAKDCDIVIEAIVEDINVKGALYKQLDEICKKGSQRNGYTRRPRRRGGIQKQWQDRFRSDYHDKRYRWRH